jgi:hypothetical protein
MIFCQLDIYGIDVNRLLDKAYRNLYFITQEFTEKVEKGQKYSTPVPFIATFIVE